MAWYDTGTVSVTNGSTTVTGAGTNFVAGVQVGEGFSGPDGRIYEIQAVVSATSLTLADAYLGSTQTGQDYKIVPTQSLVATLASQVSTLISDFQGVVDEAGAGKFDDGTAASAGITFLQDQDTGFFRPAANQIGMTVAGVQRALLTSTGLNSTVIGATTPAAGRFSTLQVGSNPVGTQTDLLMTSQAVIGSTVSINCAVESGGLFRWYEGVTSAAGGTAGGTLLATLNSTKFDIDVPVDITGNITATTGTFSGALGMSDAINYNGTGNFYVRSRLNGGIMSLGTETTAGTLYYPVVMSGTTGDTRFNTPTGESMRIDSGGRAIIPAGVTLGTSVGVYNAANTLDDYEEGNWTPDLNGSTTDPTYTHDSKYTKIGNLVTVYTSIEFTTAGSGNYSLTGASLPFLRAYNLITGTASVLDSGTAWYAGVARADNSNIIFYVNNHQFFSSTTPFTVTSGDKLNVTMTYFTSQ